jgi:hypothetical protein
VFHAAGIHAIGIAGKQVMFFESKAHAALEFANRSVLLCGPGFEDDGKDQLRPSYGVNAEHLGVGNEEAGEFITVPHIHGDLLEQVCDFVGVCGKVDADVHGSYGVVDALICHSSDLRIGDDVNGSVAAIAKRRFAQGHGFNDA